MDGAVVVALVTGCLALSGVVVTAVVNVTSRHSQQQQQAETDRKLNELQAEAQRSLTQLTAQLARERDDMLEARVTQKLMSRFRDPLLLAVYDLQSRIYNTLRQNFLQRFLFRGNVSEREYAMENTVFLFAQYFGWTEVIRRELNFLDLREQHATRRLRELQNELYRAFQSDADGAAFRVFAGEQRAIGELMADNSREDPRCLGYAAFLNTWQPGTNRWLDALRADITKLADNAEHGRGRLAAVHSVLIDMLNFLDPDKVYLPGSRSKLV